MRGKLIFFLFILIAFNGCTNDNIGQNAEPEEKPELANPAAVYCIEKGNKYEIRENPDRSQDGYCILPDGTECDEWSYFRGECPISEEAQKSFETGHPPQFEKKDTIEPGADEKIEKTETGGTKPMEIPEEIENNCFGFLIGVPEEFTTLALTGAGWARPHAGPFAWGWIQDKDGDYDFRDTDRWVKEAQENKIAILGTIWPYADWDQEKCRGKECMVSPEDQFYPWDSKGGKNGIPEYRCAPCNMQEYKDFLVILTERYDGDGVNDMPGLVIPIRYWEILNEPEMNEPFLTFFKGTQEEYVEILKASREAIRSTCPDCIIVQGGAAGNHQFMLDYWEGIFGLGGGEYIDIANIHYIGSGDLNTLNVEDFNKLMGENGVYLPIWVTEAECRSEDEVERSVEGALAGGADKIFFTRFEVGNKGPPTPGKFSPVYERIMGKCGR